MSDASKVVMYFILVEARSEYPTGKLEIEPRCADHCNPAKAESKLELLAAEPPGAGPYDYVPHYCEAEGCHKIIGYEEVLYKKGAKVALHPFNGFPKMNATILNWIGPGCVEVQLDAAHCEPGDDGKRLVSEDEIELAN